MGEDFQSGAPARPAGHGPARRRPSLFSSLTLFDLARAGQSTAISRLFRRLLPDVRRWARGRLPQSAHRRVDTDDLVQEAFVNLQRHLPQIEPRGRDTLAAYLRQSIRNRIRDEIRRAGLVEVDGVSESSDPRPSPVDEVLQREDEARYRRALGRLERGDQGLVVGRLELDRPSEMCLAPFPGSTLPGHPFPPPFPDAPTGRLTQLPAGPRRSPVPPRTLTFQGDTSSLTPL